MINYYFPKNISTERESSSSVLSVLRMTDEGSFLEDEKKRNTEASRDKEIRNFRNGTHNGREENLKSDFLYRYAHYARYSVLSLSLARSSPKTFNWNNREKNCYKRRVCVCLPYNTWQQQQQQIYIFDSVLPKKKVTKLS
jgi:hypothetical protein